MKLGRFLLDNKPLTAVEFEEKWIPLAELRVDPLLANDVILLLENWPKVKPDIVAALQRDGWQALPGHAVPCLPFQPASLRDFMLSETHAVNAARGMVKRFMPMVSPITRIYERITRRVFPAFKPKPIWYRQPIYYLSNHLNVVTDGDAVPWPQYTEALDYELELAFVITRNLYNASPEDATAAVGGFLILNDFSARDVQMAEMRSGFGPQKSKHFINGISHTVATADEILPRINQLQGEVRINDQQVCATSTVGMQHTIADILVHLSKNERLHPGELFGLGTMPGGCGMENGRWLRRGDRIELSIDMVGTLENTISE